MTGICLFGVVDTAGVIQAMCALPDGHPGTHALMSRAGEYIGIGPGEHLVICTNPACPEHPHPIEPDELIYVWDSAR